MRVHRTVDQVKFIFLEFERSFLRSLSTPLKGYFIENTYKKAESQCFSVGNIMSQPHVSIDHRNNSYVTVDMFGGSTCQENAHLKYSAMVRIICDPIEHEMEYDGDVNCAQFRVRNPLFRPTKILEFVL